MTTLSDVFPLTRIINLPERADRLRDMERQLAAIGMPFAPGRVEVFPAERPDSAAGFPGIGARGCFLSHLAILKDARSRGVESVLIVEDDACVPETQVALLTSMAQQASRKDWGILYLGHIEHLAGVAEPGWLPYTGPVACSHFYAARRSVFDPLIEYLEACLLRPPGDPVGGPMAYDGALTMFRAAHPEVITLIAQPSLAAQRSSRSDITPRFFDRLPLLRELSGLARLLRSRLLGGRPPGKLIPDRRSAPKL
jgi:hypothetical protein